MACFQVARPGLSPALGLRTGFWPRRLACRGVLPLRCRLQESNSDSNGEEPPESLFMKELRRRGMTPTSLLEESKRGSSYELGEKEMELKEESGRGRSTGQMNRNGVTSVEFEKGISDQRKRSMALNSEGLEVGTRHLLFLVPPPSQFFVSFHQLENKIHTKRVWFRGQNCF
ncbi:uncharacterized protein [Elaeis guineensis]|uniref:uncharacterized protein isoform X2 n=1 Tax=Elaeis guineensis var. tenera TaxID=51953 RepID=UPI003C6D62AD